MLKLQEEGNLLADPRFPLLQKIMVDMIDCAVAFLGPDLELLENDLKALGRRHIAYGVSAKFFPVMERAVIYALEEILGDRFTRRDSNSWQAVFYFMIQNMSEGMEAGFRDGLKMMNNL